MAPNVPQRLARGFCSAVIAFVISSSFDCKVISGNTFVIADGTSLGIFGLTEDDETELDGSILFIPRYLPLRVVSRMLCHEGDGLFECVESLEVFYDFSVSDRRKTWAVRAKFRNSIFHFFKESSIKHILHTIVYILVESFSVFLAICIGCEKEGRESRFFGIV